MKTVQARRIVSAEFRRADPEEYGQWRCVLKVEHTTTLLSWWGRILSQEVVYVTTEYGSVNGWDWCDAKGEECQHYLGGLFERSRVRRGSW